MDNIKKEIKPKMENKKEKHLLLEKMLVMIYGKIISKVKVLHWELSQLPSPMIVSGAALISMSIISIIMILYLA